MGRTIREGMACISIAKIASGKYVIGYIPSDLNGHARVITSSLGSGAPTAGTEYSWPTGGNERLTAIAVGLPNASGNIPIIFNTYNSNEPILKVRGFSVSGTGSSAALTGSSEVQLCTGKNISAENSIMPHLTYDEDNDVYLALFKESMNSSGSWHSPQYARVRAFKLTGTTPSTIGSQVTITTSGNTPQMICSLYDPIFNKHIVYTTAGSMKYFEVTTSTSSTPTVSSEKQRGNDITEVSKIGFIGATSYNPSYNKHILVGALGNNQQYRNLMGPYATASSAMTDQNFIGFSSAAYSNGDTATINVVGNTTTKSGLTPGSKYYVQANGSLGTTAGAVSVEAGTAISSTKLLIR